LGQLIDLVLTWFLFLLFQAPVTIRWYKQDGSFSERTSVDRGTLYIQDAQVDDSGVYICQAQSGSEIVRNNVTLTVGGESKNLATA
jgi:Immunoglobulin domain